MNLSSIAVFRKSIVILSAMQTENKIGTNHTNSVLNTDLSIVM